MTPASLFEQVVASDATFLWALAGAVVFALVVVVAGRPLGARASAGLAIAVSAVVLGRAWPAFVAVNLVVYGWLGLAASTSRRETLGYACLTALSVVFIVGRVLEWDRLSVPVGSASLAAYYLDMWMLLRLFTFAWEVGTGIVALPAAARFVAWALNPLFLGGPLLRFSQTPDRLAPARANLQGAGLKPVLEGIGMIGAGLAVALVFAYARRRWDDGTLVKLGMVAVAGPWTFYLTVGGFFRLVEWLSSLCGLAVPVSFRFPFLAPNIATFWSKWNLTATTVFRDYFFYNRWGLRSYNVYANTLVVFLAVGLWHGSNAYWVCFGLLHGLYFCTYLWFRPRLARLAGRRWFEAGSVALTYMAVCAAWYVPSKIVALLFR